MTGATTTVSADAAVRDVARRARPLVGRDDDHDELLDQIGDRRLVLIGEASHGTHDFYRERARITKRLIDEKGFTAVAVEADWPDAYRVNRYVRGESADTSADMALSDFERFPSWMWRNDDVVRFVEWLRARNTAHHRQTAAGFYGLDLYSLRTSMAAVVAYLDVADPAAAATARERYSCFDHVVGEGPEYGRAVSLDLTVPCENEVVAQLVDLRERSTRLLAADGLVAEDEFFVAEQNALLVRDAERYYREMYRGRVSSWNLRDRHMSATLDALMAHLARQGREAKVVVWEHNSHVGDARATELGASGELNVGQLARVGHPDDTFIVGFTTYTGEVTAATDWGGPAERKRVRPAMKGSCEELFHRTGIARFVLDVGHQPDDPLLAPLLERAIGVIYRPETERASHWFRASLAQQFDAVIHIDSTTAVRPLEPTSLWDTGEPPETYPTGL